MEHLLIMSLSSSYSAMFLFTQFWSVTLGSHTYELDLLIWVSKNKILSFFSLWLINMKNCDLWPSWKLKSITITQPVTWWKCFLVTDNRWTHSSSWFTMAVLQGQLWGFAWLSKDLQSCGPCCSADGALCLFVALFLEEAPLTEPFTSTGHKWPSWTPH